MNYWEGRVIIVTVTSNVYTCIFEPNICIMMKFLSTLLLFVALATGAQAQQTNPVVTQKKLKVVFQLTTNDTLAQKALVKQIHNFMTAAPKAKVEVVCHNNGITFLQSNVTKQAEGIKALAARGVDFVACENTLRERKIDKKDLLPEISFVPAGVVEIVLKQDKGWAYIKAGI